MSRDASWYRWDGNELVLHLLIQPRSSRDAFGDVHNHRLKLRLTAPPVDGKANQHLLAYLAKQFGVPKSSVRISAGDSSRLKTVVLPRPGRLPEELGLAPAKANNS